MPILTLFYSQNSLKGIVMCADKQITIVGDSPQVRALRQQIHDAAPHKSTILITGESGTGKELIANALHRLSRRAQAPLIPFNCTAAPSELIESQLFGHRKGSFTGAFTDSPGIIRAAHGGTLCLDEIGDLSPTIQPKLLRFLQEGEVLTVGEHTPRLVDVRVIAATNKNLEVEVEAGRFRLDLFHRLNVVHIEVPPLRDRLADIPLLAEHICRVVLPTRLHLATPVQLHQDAMEALAKFAVHYHWPGNVRELENLLLAAAVASGVSGHITLEQLVKVIASKLRRGHTPERAPEDAVQKNILFALPEPIYGYPEGEDLGAFVSGIVEKVITTAIKQTGSKAAAARALGTDPSSLRSRLEHAQRVLGHENPKL